MIGFLSRRETGLVPGRNSRSPARNGSTPENGEQTPPQYARCVTCGYTRLNAPSAFAKCCGKPMATVDAPNLPVAFQTPAAYAKRKN